MISIGLAQDWYVCSFQHIYFLFSSALITITQPPYGCFTLSVPFVEGTKWSDTTSSYCLLNLLLYISYIVLTPLPACFTLVILTAINLSYFQFFFSYLTQLACLKIIFTAAIQKAFPQVESQEFGVGIITRCGNPSFGDFQCNNSLAIAKYFKTFSNYTGEGKKFSHNSFFFRDVGDDYYFLVISNNNGN